MRSNSQTATSPNSRSSPRSPLQPGFVLLLLLAAVLPYVASSRFGFVYDDDVQVLGDPAIRSWHFVPDYFAKPISFFTNTRSVRYYRPVFFLWFRLNYFLWGPHSLGWHCANIFLHTVASLLVFGILRCYFANLRWAFAGALLFAVHPIHVESVAWVSGSTDALLALFLFASLLTWMRATEAAWASARVLSLLLFCVALLTKETAIVLPAIIFLHGLLKLPSSADSGAEPRFPIAAAIRQALPYLALAIAYLLLRGFVLKRTPASPAWLSIHESLLTVPKLILLYAADLILPWNLSAFYQPVVTTRPTLLGFWLPLACLVAMCGLACLSVTRAKCQRYVIAVGWFVLPLAPVLYIRMFQQDDFFHDRYLYIPALAVSMFAAIALEFAERRKWMVPGLPLEILPLTLLTLAFAALTVRETKPWRNNLSLYEQAVRISPANAMARNNLASEYARRGDYSSAATLLRSVLRDRPNMWLANYNYGYVSYQSRDFRTAAEFLRRAIAVDPSDPDQYLYLGLTCLKSGRLREAEEQIRQAIARNPRGNGYHLTLALIQIQSGNYGAARSELDQELESNPANQPAVGRLQAAIP